MLLRVITWPKKGAFLQSPTSSTGNLLDAVSRWVCFQAGSGMRPARVRMSPEPSRSHAGATSQVDASRARPVQSVWPAMQAITSTAMHRFVQYAIRYNEATWPRIAEDHDTAIQVPDLRPLRMTPYQAPELNFTAPVPLRSPPSSLPWRVSSAADF